jgi:uncharacterized protein YutE (UPF0331/DUF86 family)
MVDREIFSRRLVALRGYLGKLKAFLDAPEEEFVREPALHDLAERYLHLAVEACLDLANHWIGDRGLPVPDANRDTFTILEKAGELPAELAERLRGWAGFRNVLVHEYLEIDLGEVSEPCAGRQFNDDPKVWMIASMPGLAWDSSMAAAIISRTVS